MRSQNDWWIQPDDYRIRHADTAEPITTLPHRQAVLDYLTAMPDKERRRVEVVVGWRVEYGDYVFDLLSMNKDGEQQP